MKLKSLILAMFLTLGMASSFANGSTNNLTVNESSASFSNLIEKFDLSNELASTEVSYSIVEEDCTWTKFIRTTIRHKSLWGVFHYTEVEVEIIWRCV